MGLFNSIDVSASGLTAERLRMDIISENIANAETTRTAAGGPYRRKLPIYKELSNKDFSSVFEEALGQKSGSGVEVIGIEEDMSPFIRKYDDKGIAIMSHDYNFCLRAKELGFEEE